MSIDAPPTAFAARCYGLTKTYGEGDATIYALNNVTLGFGQGQFTAVMGPSGSGKSTLVQCMAGLDYITSGRLFIGDDEIQHLDPTQLTLLRRKHLGFIFQAYNLVPSLTAKQNILLPYKLAKTAISDATLHTVAASLGIEERLNHRPSELSGGQQQRVAVARALVGTPQIIFADEPTGNLDSTSAANLLGILKHSSHELGQSVVMVTHDPSAAAMTDRVIFLRDGQVAAEMTDPTLDRIIDHLAGDL